MSLEPSPFEEDPIMSASLGAPAAPLSMAPASQAGAGAGSVHDAHDGGVDELVSGSQTGGQSSMVHNDILDGFETAPAPALGEAAPATNSPASAADTKDAKAEEPKGPTPYSLWEEKHQQKLAEKRAKESEAKKALAVQAKEEVTKFYAQRTDRIAASKTQNRVDEKTTKAEIANLFQFGAQWEKVGKLIALAPKANEKRHVDRMRKLLLTLKNDNATDSKKGGGGADVKTPKA